ncbi:sigma-70 family RNA polymerase sigma factor [Pseudomonas silvicola]|uniref:sigma-70 family RNA polymerase sigma factor n=1 Tax=Pseudomonas sp. RIT-To-2 TaxID=3462541 RepID=UPI00227D20AC|nr:sigma-70 family RNA polymerase sigma factor [Pseudomonas silvicola]
MSRHLLLASLFKDHYTWLRSRAARAMGCHFSGEDIAAETFLRVLGLPDLSAVREPRALLTTIAKRLMVDTWRRGDLERAYLASLQDEPANSVPTPDERAELVEMLLRLDQLLDGLPGLGKAVFVHSYLGGLTYVEIGQQLGISKSRVQQYMEQALAQCLLVLVP